MPVAKVMPSERAIDDDTWIAILKGLAEQAQYGDARCAQLLITYAFGVSPSPLSQPANAKRPAQSE